MELTKQQKIYEEIVQKAWEDDEFMNALVANPINTIEDFIGMKLNLPNGKTLIVDNQTDISKVYINLPAKPNNDDMELHEEQLDAVAGGGFIGSFINRLEQSLQIFS